jgi:hypothetical protein
MRSRRGPVLVWLAATIAAIAVASLAISQVGRQVVLDTPIDERLAQAATARDEADATTQPEPAPDPSTAAADDPPTADQDPGALDVRTYDAIGGSAAVAVQGETIELRWATPRDGFRASVERSPSGAELRVDFRSDGHRSRIKVEVVAGQVRDEIEEDDR